MGLFTTLPLRGGDYLYEKGQISFEIEETRSEYKIFCTRSGKGMNSRNKNIADRQLRMTAIDLMGAYILYKSSGLSNDLGPDFFPIYVNGINLHYNAYLEGVRQEEVTHEGKPAICYVCKKDSYIITSATYQERIDIPSLLIQNYSNAKNESSAALLYKYPGFTSEQYVMLERDFLQGEVQLPDGIRGLQAKQDRFEQSVFDMSESSGLIPNKSTIPETVPYSHFFLEELVTAASLKEKEIAYREWQKRLQKNSVYEEILLFCAQNCRQKTPSKNDASFCSVVSAFPGAVSPFGIRQPINNTSYQRASRAYSQSQFEDAISILEEIVDMEGISPEILNLLGASYRFVGKYKEAMPYLLLCLKLQPETPYLMGNIYMCLIQLGFQQKEALKSFLISLAKDSWSIEAINK